jgi:hypothetical protein
MKKVKECSKKKLSIKLPNMTVTAKVDEKLKLKKGDHIQINIGKLTVYGIVATDQSEDGNNIDKIEVDEVETIEKSKIKVVFFI